MSSSALQTTLRRYVEGNTTVLIATLDYGDPPQDPVAITFLHMVDDQPPPAAHAWPGAPEITNPSTGVFHLRLDLPPARYDARFEATFADGTRVSKETSFEVLPTKVK